MGQPMIRVLAVCVAVAVLAGCQTTRVREQDAMEGAPEWALRNAMMAGSPDMVYFVGVSGEQVLSETEALDQAYENALRRVADAIGVQVEGWDRANRDSEASAKARWPHVTGKHLGSAGPTLIPTISKSEYGRSGSSDLDSQLENELQRNQLVRMAQVVDTWTIRENYRMDVSVNQMKYGELWKAKVLVSVPRDELKAQVMKAPDVRVEVREVMVPAPTPAPRTFSFMDCAEG